MQMTQKEGSQQNTMLETGHPPMCRASQLSLIVFPRVSFLSQRWKLLYIRHIKRWVLAHPTAHRWASSHTLQSPQSPDQAAEKNFSMWMVYIHCHKPTLSQPLDGSMLKQGILPLRVCLPIGSFLSASSPHRQLAHLQHSETRFQFLTAIQDPSVFGHPLFERVLVCGEKREEEIKGCCLPCRKQLPRQDSLWEGKARETTQPRPLLWSLASTLTPEADFTHWNPVYSQGLRMWSTLYNA